ncbi:MAG: 16S rRNA (cytosine(1402)-N(4))-methyltransferase RsmH [Armatimonadetes bacterium]|nr:16S rRNA (cytosine(1402)-N(4))-methyltransferase RsmH [Armatimonadota bacterium]
MVAELLALMGFAAGQVMCDGTLGDASHLLAILPLLAPGGRVLALDLDQESLARARERVGTPPVEVEFRHASFADLAGLAAGFAPHGFDRILLDLGLSIAQTRGRFSFRGEHPLDFRLDRSRGETCAEYLARVPEPELVRVLQDYGGEPHARRIAAEIVRRRQTAPLRTTAELAEAVLCAYPPRARHGRLHVATRTFQALRIQVADLLGALDTALRDAPRLLRAGGRLAVYAYHSAEDRRVKLAFRALAESGEFELLTRRAVQSSRTEREQNPGSRSAKLRVLRARGGADRSGEN